MPPCCAAAVIVPKPPIVLPTVPAPAPPMPPIKACRASMTNILMIWHCPISHGLSLRSRFRAWAAILRSRFWSCAIWEARDLWLRNDLGCAGSAWGIRLFAVSSSVLSHLLPTSLCPGEVGPFPGTRRCRILNFLFTAIFLARCPRIVPVCDL